jgi:sulfate adenylyltransferase
VTRTGDRPAIPLDRRSFLELEKLALGTFAPLAGFMTEPMLAAVVDEMRLPDGTPFPLPVVLDADAAVAGRLVPGRPADLVHEGRRVGEIEVGDVHRPDRIAVARAVFGTADSTHPGVRAFLNLREVFVGGTVRLDDPAAHPVDPDELSPAETRALFAERGWRTVVGFQTRNVPHRAHEYQHRRALELADGLFIQPLIGHRKPGDYTAEAILAGYRTYIDRFLPRDRVVLGTLSTSMRYAGPREAVFHALIRRNHGCSHFIVGRDHAGVGDWYGIYEAQELTRRFDGELGIEILRLPGPFHCRTCDEIVTERTCPHRRTDPAAITEVSGTLVRSLLAAGNASRPEIVRPEVVDAIADLPLFIKEDAA